MHHRPWAIGHKAQQMLEHESGAVEGWIGGEAISVATSARLPQALWMGVQLVPHFVTSEACLRMAYNGDVLAAYSLYSQPFLKRVTIVATHNELGVAVGATLGQKDFDGQETDIAIDMVERDGVCRMNGQATAVSIALGGSWCSDPTPRVGVPLPQVGLGGVKHATIRVKPAPVSLCNWVKQGGLAINAHGKMWVSTDIEIYQHPVGRVRWVEAP